MNIKDIFVGQSVFVESSPTSLSTYEFAAKVVSIDTVTGIITVRDQDDDCFDVEVDELSIDDENDFVPTETPLGEEIDGGSDLGNDDY